MGSPANKEIALIRRQEGRIRDLGERRNLGLGYRVRISKGVADRQRLALFVRTNGGIDTDVLRSAGISLAGLQVDTEIVRSPIPGGAVNELICVS